MLPSKLLFLVALFVFATGVNVKSDVLDLKDSNFKNKVADHDIILVEFFAPWCGHCKRLAPEYDKAASVLKNNDPPVPLAKVDCTAESNTCQEYGVSGYPTLKIFRKGEFSEEYNGPREADGIVKYMKSKAGPSSKTLYTTEDAEKITSSQDFAVVGFFSSESEMSKTFQKVADSLSSEFKFAHTFESSILDEYGFKDAIVMFQPPRLHSKFEESKIKYSGDLSTTSIKEWVKETSIGLCGHRVQDNVNDFKKPLVVAFYAVDYVKNSKGTNYWRNRVMKVAKKFKEAGKDVTFAISNRFDFSYEVSEFGAGELPSEKPIVTLRDSKDRKFVMKEEFSMDNLESFVNDFLDDKLQPYLKSESVPSDNSAPVKVVVAKNFDEIVNDKSKDVLIEYYAPWCGHCKSLEPKYTELAELLADESEITIAKMDATANDVSKPYEVSGFPTIYFAPKDSKDAPLKYNGGREVDDFVKYLAKEATNELKGYTRSGGKKKTKKAKKEL
ncbi:protein disulfide-isomerase A3 [Octopus sinensis]|nr:protein disulfide-isomerase A3 [Octopus sinensis]